jgi:hypothetical protein
MDVILNRIHSKFYLISDAIDMISYEVWVGVKFGYLLGMIG